MATEGSVIALGLMASALLGATIALVARYLIRKYILDIGKVWAVTLNGNTGLGWVGLVKPTKEGIKANDTEVKTELNFGFQHRHTHHRIFVVDEDTGLLIRPYDGEIEVADPAPNLSKDMSDHIHTIKTATERLPWNAIIAGLVLVSIIASAVLMVMVTQIGG